MNASHPYPWSIRAKELQEVSDKLTGFLFPFQYEVVAFLFHTVH